MYCHHIGKYKDKILCHKFQWKLPMSYWANHDNLIESLKPLTPMEVIKDQIKLKKKEKEKEKNLKGEKIKEKKGKE
ncbi:hypothetical protein CR513_56356, partial [Mucuna pruriens]